MMHPPLQLYPCLSPHAFVFQPASVQQHTYTQPPSKAIYKKVLPILPASERLKESSQGPCDHKPDIAKRTYNPNSSKAEAGGLCVQ